MENFFINLQNKETIKFYIYNYEENNITKYFVGTKKKKEYANINENIFYSYIITEENKQQ
jgi:hypothetical protein